jgi:hypothetical protein
VTQVRSHRITLSVFGHHSGAHSTHPDIINWLPTFLPGVQEQDVEDGLSSRMASLLQYSVKGDDNNASLGRIDDQDLKGRYY